MSRYAFAAAAALSALFASSAAMAATLTASTNFTVQVKIIGGCTVVTTAGNAAGAIVNIGDSAGILATALSSATGTGTVSTTCTTGTDYSIKLVSTGGSFTMKGAVTNLATIPYTVTYTGISSGGGSSTLATNASVLHNTSVGTFTSGSAPQVTGFKFTPGTPTGTLIPDTYKDSLSVTVEY